MKFRTDVDLHVTYGSYKMVQNIGDCHCESKRCQMFHKVVLQHI